MDEAQIPMFVDDLNEAIRATVNALGGMKAVGVELKPEKSAVDAGKWLADCLNHAKRDRLDPTSSHTSAAVRVLLAATSSPRLKRRTPAMRRRNRSHPRTRPRSCSASSLRR